MSKTTKSKKTTAKPKTKEENDEYFTEEEIKRLDKLHDKTEHLFDDTEIYDLMQKYGDNDEAILNDSTNHPFTTKLVEFK